MIKSAAHSDSESSSSRAGDTETSSTSGMSSSNTEASSLPGSTFSEPDLSVSTGRSAASQASVTERSNPRTVFFMTEKGTLMAEQEGLKRSNIISHTKCNHEFFHELRESYWKHRGWLRRLFGLDTFSHCDFYRVSMEIFLVFLSSCGPLLTLQALHVRCRPLRAPGKRGTRAPPRNVLLRAS